MKTKFPFFRIIVAVLLLVIIFKNVDFYRAGGFFRNLNLTSVFFILLISFVLIFISTYKWKIFLCYLNLPLPFLRLFNYYIIGYFFNNFLPTNFGGDIVKFLFTARGKETYSDSLVAVFMDRFTGIIALSLFVIVSFPLALYQFNFLENIKYIILENSCFC